MSDVSEKLCECGCGKATKPLAWNQPKDLAKAVMARFLHGHNSRGEKNHRWNSGNRYSNGYVFVPGHGHPSSHHGYVQEHVLIAEKALGGYLPKGAVVHHVNEVKHENRNTNLVICQDHAYHFLLHRRTKAFRACGNPTWRSCTFCHEHDDTANLYVSPSGQIYHRSCRNEYLRNNRRG